MKRAFTRAIGAVSVFLVLALAARAGDVVPRFQNFITRQGDKLMDGDM